MSQPRIAAATLSAFSLLALALAAIGLFGVLSHDVSQRRRELGVRSALGASRAALVRMVLRRGIGVTAAGVALGLLASLLATSLLQSLLFGIGPRDPLAFLAAPVLLLAVALVACLPPAWRAAGADPREALRAE